MKKGAIVNLPLHLSPIENPSSLDRVMRLVVAALVNAGVEPAAAYQHAIECLKGA